MLTKNYRWSLALIAILFVGILSLSGKTSYVSADQIENQISSTSSSCLSCHDDLYYLYDMGKSYCITEHKDRCVNCHEGNPTALNKDESHLGLIAYPQKDNGAKCQQCHPQDSQTRLDKFALMGGYKTVNEAVPYTPIGAAVTGFPEIPEANQIVENLPWVAGAVVFFGLWLALVLFSPQKP
jgi:hypothetical protein